MMNTYRGRERWSIAVPSSLVWSLMDTYRGAEPDEHLSRPGEMGDSGPLVTGPERSPRPFSYTHLTPPTTYSV